MEIGRKWEGGGLPHRLFQYTLPHSPPGAMDPVEAGLAFPIPEKWRDHSLAHSPPGQKEGERGLYGIVT